MVYHSQNYKHNYDRGATLIDGASSAPGSAAALLESYGIDDDAYPAACPPACAALDERLPSAPRP